MSPSITDVPGVRVGHRTLDGSGVTVIVLPVGTIGSGEVRGGAPASRELALLEPTRTVEHVDAIVLAGGSAFGLAAADGAMTVLEAEGRGFPTRVSPVPIVPTAAIYDLEPGRPRPGAGDGAAAARAALEGTAIEAGAVGAGTGATVGKWKGHEFRARGGLGSWSAREGDATVGVLVVVNAIGDVYDVDGTLLAGSAAPPGAPSFPLPGFTEQTTLLVVATDARLSKGECHLLAQSAHVGLARTVHPSFTRFDGDLAIAVATGAVDAHLDRLRVVVVETVAAAVRAAVRTRPRGR